MSEPSKLNLETALARYHTAADAMGKEATQGDPDKPVLLARAVVTFIHASGDLAVTGLEEYARASAKSADAMRIATVVIAAATVLNVLAVGAIGILQWMRPAAPPIVNVAPPAVNVTGPTINLPPAPKQEHKP